MPWSSIVIVLNISDKSGKLLCKLGKWPCKDPKTENPNVVGEIPENGETSKTKDDVQLVQLLRKLHLHVTITTIAVAIIINIASATTVIITSFIMYNTSNWFFSSTSTSSLFVSSASLILSSSSAGYRRRVRFLREEKKNRSFLETSIETDRTENKDRSFSQLWKTRLKTGRLTSHSSQQGQRKTKT